MSLLQSWGFLSRNRTVGRERRLPIPAFRDPITRRDSRNVLSRLSNDERRVRIHIFVHPFTVAVASELVCFRKGNGFTPRLVPLG